MISFYFIRICGIRWYMKYCSYFFLISVSKTRSASYCFPFISFMLGIHYTFFDKVKNSLGILGTALRVFRSVDTSGFSLLPKIIVFVHKFINYYCQRSPSFQCSLWRPPLTVKFFRVIMEHEMITSVKRELMDGSDGSDGEPKLEIEILNFLVFTTRTGK